MMNKQELKALDIGGLQEQYNLLVKEHFKLRVLKSTDQLTQTHKFKDIKRKIAQVKTFIKIRQNDG